MKIINWKNIGVWIKWFLLGAALIVVYKTFDNWTNMLNGLSSLVSVFAPFILGLVIAYFLYRPYKWLKNKFQGSNNSFLQKFSSALSVLIIYIAFIAAIALAIMGIFPMLIKNISSFVADLPTYINSLGQYLITISSEGQPLELFSEQINKFVNSFNADSIVSFFTLIDISTIAPNVITTATSFVSIITDIVVGIVSSIYMIVEKDTLLKQIKRLLSTFMSQNIKTTLKELWHKTDIIIYRYFVGQFSDCIIVSIGAIVILLTAKIDNAISLGFIFGMFNIIPYFGPIIGSVIVVLITLLTTKNFIITLIILACLLVWQQIDANLIGPRILGGALDISPFWVIFAVTVGGGLFGFIGMLIGVPAIAILRMVFNYFVNRRIGDDISEALQDIVDSDSDTAKHKNRKAVKIFRKKH